MRYLIVNLCKQTPYKAAVLSWTLKFQKNFVICFMDSPLKMLKNDFLSHFESSFRSRDIS